MSTSDDLVFLRYVEWVGTIGQIFGALSNVEDIMTKSPEQLRRMYLAGTVSIPPRFPELADITFEGGETRDAPIFVVTSQRISPKVVIRRTFFAYDVTSIFIPHDPTRVDYELGDWFEGQALMDKQDLELNSPGQQGIVYVRENAQAILEMEAGMTAAESAEYYPPLPDDRSINHYDMNSVTSLNSVKPPPGCY